MPVILILDAYNILKQIAKATTINEQERRAFITFMADYAALRSHSVILVFDDGPYERPTTVQKGQLSIVYSGRHDSADDVIKKYVQEIPVGQKANVLIVSSDRGLYSFASRQGIYSIGSVEFYRLVAERLAKKASPLVKSHEQARKLHKLESNPELDLLMQEASKAIIDKDLLVRQKSAQKNTNVPSLSKGERLARSEKKMLKILKKL